MAKRRNFQFVSAPLWVRYPSAMAIFAAAMLVRFFILPLEAGLAFLTLYPATAITALLFGAGPGLVVVVLGALAGPYVFMPPYGAFGFSFDRTLSTSVFAVSGVIVCFMAETMHRRTVDIAQANRQLNEAMEALQQREAELEVSNEDLAEFAYIASHDLKAPLRAIRNLADWVREDVAGNKVNDETLENLDLMHRRVERLDLLLDGLLQYSRIGRIKGDIESIDIGRMIADIAGYLSPAPEFAVEYAGDIPALTTYRVPLEQVLRNLIGNALKHHDRKSGSVIVSCRDACDLVEFRVEDDGPGIPPEYHQRIFVMFQTLKSRDQVEGSGMGLAIVKKAVARHGGTVRVESDPARRGTAFIFTWQKETGA